MLNWSLPSLERATTPTERPSNTIGTTSIDSSISSVPSMVWPRMSFSASLISSGSPCSATQPVNEPSPMATRSRSWKSPSPSRRSVKAIGSQKPVSQFTA